jgi:putative transposase
MVRLQAAQMFNQGIDPVQVARQLRVSAKSVYQWRRRWRAGGPLRTEAAPGQIPFFEANSQYLARDAARQMRASGWAVR